MSNHRKWLSGFRHATPFDGTKIPKSCKEGSFALSYAVSLYTLTGEDRAAIARVPELGSAGVSGSFPSPHSSGHRMVHFEFGQDRLAEPHPLNTFELLRVRSKAPSSYFQRPCSGSLVRFAKSLFFAAMRPQPFRQRLLDPPEGWCRHRGCSHAASRAPSRWIQEMAEPPLRSLTGR